MTNTKTVAIEISDERLLDVFTSACEGGINYWCQTVTPGKDDKRLVDGGTVLFHQRADVGSAEPIVREFSFATMRQAIGEMLVADNRAIRRHAGDFLAENDDATTADVIVQWTIFGTVIYG